MSATILILGGGSAGCVLASRLSEVATNRVLLVEAGQDFDRSPPQDILASYAGRALYNPQYFWPGMKAYRGGSDTVPMNYEQARVLGGGSSINGQVALRGAPRDFDRWEELGAAGWNWNSVLPYFRKLESDLDFSDQGHGAEGPIVIRRIPPAHWDGFTHAVVDGWRSLGFDERQDMNGSFEEGYASIPVSHDGQQRVSTALGYLTDEVRRRPNLTILPDTEVRRLIVDKRRIVAVEVRNHRQTRRLAGDKVVLCAGALRTPWLLMRSGIGPALHLREHGIAPVVDLPGVGANLQDHPAVSITTFMPRSVRRPAVRHNYVNLVYSSGLPGTPMGDMVMSVVSKTAWHALGDRFGALSTYIGKPFSRGLVRVDSNKLDDHPKITFNWLADERDLKRAVKGFRLMATILRSGPLEGRALDPFAVGFSAKVKRLGARTLKNRVMTSLAGLAMDGSSFARHQIIERFASDGLSLDALLADPDTLAEYLRSTVTGFWHPSGTCRMGRTDDPYSVVDPEGRVIGLDNLFVADASIMPEIPTCNLNIPTIMIGERIADLIKQGGMNIRRRRASQ